MNSTRYSLYTVVLFVIFCLYYATQHINAQAANQQPHLCMDFDLTSSLPNIDNGSSTSYIQLKELSVLVHRQFIEDLTEANRAWMVYIQVLNPSQYQLLDGSRSNIQYLLPLTYDDSSYNAYMLATLTSAISKVFVSSEWSNVNKVSARLVWFYQQCSNGAQDGSESDVDCGGPLCLQCRQGRLCNSNEDCLGSLTCLPIPTTNLKYCTDINSTINISLSLLSIALLCIAIIVVV